uniref:TGB1 n=1 Tax=Yucca alphaflexivirus 1 TaxID=2794423 RepID=A0A7T5UFB5_9VIRU|nr:TGB1 [Yucca alphaflexivirus 1]
MDFLLTLLDSNASYTRTSIPLSLPLVVHAVAGAGKTHLLTQLLHSCPSVTVHTLGAPIPRDSTCRGSGGDLRVFNVLDEYQIAADTSSYQALFGDPLQGPSDKAYPDAHYVNTTSLRFGRQTCQLLNSIGITCSSVRPDQVVVQRPFGAEPRGQVIALDSEGFEYLRAHQLQPRRPCELAGQTFDECTVLVTRRLRDYQSNELYIALTRHRYSLLLLTPYAAG